MTFEELLARDAAERHRRILVSTRRAGLPSRMPPGYRAEDFMPGLASDGFVPLADAAETMCVTVAEVVRLAEQGTQKRATATSAPPS